MVWVARKERLVSAASTRRRRTVESCAFVVARCAAAPKRVRVSRAALIELELMVIGPIRRGRFGQGISQRPGIGQRHLRSHPGVELDEGDRMNPGSGVRNRLRGVW